MMKKIYCNKFKTNRKFRNPRTSYIFKKTLVYSIICDKCGSKDKEVLKEEKIEILKILGLIKNIEDYRINI